MSDFFKKNAKKEYIIGKASQEYSHTLYIVQNK